MALLIRGKLTERQYGGEECVTLDKLLYFSKSQCLHPKNGDNK